MGSPVLGGSFVRRPEPVRALAECAAPSQVLAERSGSALCATPVQDEDRQ